MFLGMEEIAAKFDRKRLRLPKQYGIVEKQTVGIKTT